MFVICHNAGSGFCGFGRLVALGFFGWLFTFCGWVCGGCLVGLDESCGILILLVDLDFWVGYEVYSIRSESGLGMMSYVCSMRWSFPI